MASFEEQYRKYSAAGQAINALSAQYERNRRSFNRQAAHKRSGASGGPARARMPR